MPSLVFVLRIFLAFTATKLLMFVFVCESSNMKNKP